jgi:hypothetical protein
LTRAVRTKPVPHSTPPPPDLRMPHQCATPCEVDTGRSRKLRFAKPNHLSTFDAGARVSGSEQDIMVSRRRGPNDPNELLATAARTLLASGYVITSADRHPPNIELNCERTSRLGALVRFRIAITPNPAFDPADVKAIHRTAKLEGRAVVLVGMGSAPGQISWVEFERILGGAVPAWRALTEAYGPAMATAAKNKVPPGMSGEAWAIFEDLTADGLEFLFGRRVARLGGTKRGLRVSDMIAQLPDSSLLIVDCKAYDAGLDVTWASLRALREYVEKQQQYQQGRNEVIAALIVSSGFRQTEARLERRNKEFLGETRVPLCFVEASTLVTMVMQLRGSADLRNSVRWRSLFSGGLISQVTISKELRAVKTERFDSGDA